MKVIVKILFAGFLLILIGYLLLPSPNFPLQPPDAVQSLEDADTEIPLRRAYFTNFTREEVLAHYQRQFEWSFLGIPLLTYRLNYPPEDAQALIRDQTRSTFLEEIIHPFRESFFVNGFKPSLAKDDIWYKGRHFEQKITVKYVPSSIFVRFPLAIFSFVALWFLAREWLAVARRLMRAWSMFQ